MKGPYQRLKHDLRRLWECPVCGHRTHASGHVTSVLCACQQQVDLASRRFMKLIEVTPRRVHVGTGQVTPLADVAADKLAGAVSVLPMEVSTAAAGVDGGKIEVHVPPDTLPSPD